MRVPLTFEGQRCVLNACGEGEGMCASPTPLYLIACQESGLQSGQGKVYGSVWRYVRARPSINAISRIVLVQKSILMDMSTAFLFSFSTSFVLVNFRFLSSGLVVIKQL